MVGAIFADVAVSLLVARTGFGEPWVDRRAGNALNFPHKMRLRSAEVASGNRRVRDDQFMLGSCKDHCRILRHCK